MISGATPINRSGNSLRLLSLPKPFPGKNSTIYEGLVTFIIKVPINPGVKHKMNLTFYVMNTKGLEFGLDKEVRV